MRPDSWYAPHRRIQMIRRRLKVCGAAFALILVIIPMIIVIGNRLERAKDRSDGIMPSETPSSEPKSTPAPQIAPAPVIQDVEIWPVQPTVAPQKVTVEMPSLSIGSADDLACVYRWMIASGESSIRFNAYTLNGEMLSDITEKYSNYLEAYKFDENKLQLTVRFKPGLRVLLAIEAGAEDYLSDEEAQIARDAKRIISDIIRPNMTDYQKELAIHDYICDHCAYFQLDNGVPVSDARGFFQYGLCQCAGFVDTFRLFAKLAGLDVEMIGGQTTRDLPGSKGHAWNLIRLDGLWYAVDVTWDDMLGGSQPGHAFFNLPVSALEKSRSWDQTVSPKGDYALSIDSHYYYFQSPYVVKNREEAFNSAALQLAKSSEALILFADTDESVALCGDLSAYTGKTITAKHIIDDIDVPVYIFS